jgi:uncharacterized protein
MIAVLTRLVVLLVLAWFAMPAHAQILWEISGNGLEKPSYLFGTIHMGEKRAYTHEEKILPYIAEIDVLAGELDLQKNPMSDLFAIMPMMVMKDTTLRQLLDEEDYNMVKEAVREKMPMLYALVDKIKPIFLSVLLAEEESMLTRPDTTQEVSRPPLDLFLQQEAREMGKKVIGLESIEEQFRAFTSLPLTEQAAMLVNGMRNKEKQAQNDGTDETLDQMLNWYAEQQIDSLYQFAVNSTSENFNRSLLEIRNETMTERIEKKIQMQRLFIAVGTAHLPGEKGIIALLRSRGYTLTPIQD